MKRYILTGTPRAGKTTILRELERLGYGVVEEAATEVIARGRACGVAEPWAGAGFVDAVVALQRERQVEASTAGAGAQFYDRSPLCTHGLSAYQGRRVSATLAAELDRIARERVYQPRVFFVRNLGFCEPSAARRISFEESLVFERLHERSYRAAAATRW